MAYEALQAVIGTAVVDAGFRAALLDDSRRRVVDSFKLTCEEMDAVMSIRADTLEQFAGQVDQWIMQQQQQAEPPTLDLPIRPNTGYDESNARRDPLQLHDRTSAPAIASWSL